MNDSLRQYVEKITKLPTLPMTAQEILGLVDDERLPVDKLEKIIENDPAISAKVLSVANSAYFGVKSPTRELGSAIMRIGFNNVKNIAVGVSLITVMEDGGKKSIADYQRVFNHSVSVGFISRMLAKEIKCGISDEIMMDGMLHDIGFLVMIRYFSEDYKKVIEVYQDNKNILESEEAVFEFTHADIGHWLAEKWTLPENIKDTVLYHHKPSLANNNQKHVAVIHQADYIVSKNMIAPSRQDPNFPFEQESLEILGLTESDFTRLEEKILSSSNSTDFSW